MKNKGKGFTLADLRNSPAAKLNPHLFPEYAKDQPAIRPEGVQEEKKASKFHNKKIVVQGILFDSIKEGNRWTDLQRLLKAGEIGFLERQVPYELNEGGTHSMKYYADFRYVDARTGQTIVEDCKGNRTKEYKKRAKLMLKLFGIKILET